MDGFNDYVELERPDGKKVRVVFELCCRNEILYHYFEFKHDENSEWEALKKGEDGYHSYTVKNEKGEEQEEKILFPSPKEIADASDEINKKYNILEA